MNRYPGIEADATPSDNPVRRREVAWIFLSYSILAALMFGPTLAAGRVMAPGDAGFTDYPIRQFALHHWQSGDWAWWFPHEFLGTSLAGIIHNGYLYPLNVIYFTAPYAVAFNLFIIIHGVLAAGFTCLLVRRFGGALVPAFISGTLFGFSGFMAAHKGHISMVAAAAWLPLILYCHHRLAAGERRFAGAAALALAMQLLAGHPQVSLQTGMLVVAFIIWSVRRVRTESRITYIAWAALSFVLMVLIALPQLCATLQLLGRAARETPTYEFFSEYSFPPLMLPLTAFPFCFGGAYGNGFWGGGTPVEFSFYVGLLPLSAAWIAWRERHRLPPVVRFWAVVVVVALLLAIGNYNPLYRVLFHLPIIRLFRCPSRYWLSFDLAVVVLCGLGLSPVAGESSDAWRLRLRQIARMAVWISGAAVLGWLAALRLLAVPAIWRWSKFPRSYQPPSYWGLTGGAIWHPLLLTGAGIALLFCASRSWRAARWGLIGLLAVVVIDSAQFGLRVYPTAMLPEPGEIERAAHSPEQEFLAKNIAGQRYLGVGNSLTPLYAAPVMLNRLNGYDPLIDDNLKILTGMQTSGTSNEWALWIRNNWLLSALGVKYLLLPASAPAEVRAALKTAPGATAWTSMNTTIGDGTVHLASPDGKRPALLSVPLAVSPGTRVQVKMELRSGTPPRDIVCFDLYAAPDYDSSNQELQVLGGNIGPAYHEFSAEFDTGNPPPTVLARVFTLSRTPVEARNISVRIVGRPAVSAQWRMEGATADGNGFRLAAMHDGVALMSNRVALHPATDYRIEFEARSDSANAAPVFADLFGGALYDQAEQELMVAGTAMAREYRPFVSIVNSGKSAPPEVDFRIFTASRVPIFVRNPRLVEIGRYQPPPASFPSAYEPSAPELYRRVFSGQTGEIYENSHVMPRIHAVTQLLPAANAFEVRQNFAVFAADPMTTAFVKPEVMQKLGGEHFGPGALSVSLDAPGQFAVETNFPAPGFVVISDQFASGWSARFNESVLPIYEVDGVLNGVRVPAGRGRLYLHYRPLWMLPAFIVSILGLAASLFLMRLKIASW